MISLISALIRQTIELLLSCFETTIDLSETRFHQLDGSAESWTEPVVLLQELIELIPNKVLCVVEGLHWTNDRSTERHSLQIR